MQLLIFIAVILLSTITIQAQQNLFNIPSGDITPKGKIFYQHQLNLYPSKLESKGHFVYGLGSGWDAGVNLVSKAFSFKKGPELMSNSNPALGALAPVLMGTLQKQITLIPGIDINAGVQAGTNLSNRLTDKSLNYFVYSVGTFHIAKGNRIVGGVWNGNREFLGKGNTTGIMAGFETKLSRYFYLMGDWISGTNEASGLVIGGMYNAGKNVQICAGLFEPNPDSGKERGIVLELNLMGWNVFGDDEGE
jgi:hypothetical protein